MAVTAPTKTTDFAGFLKPDEAQPYFDQARRSSVVQSLARQVPLGANGIETPIVTSKPTAAWVAEGGQKPATKGSLALKSMQPKKIAAIAVVSAEVVRANPGNYVNIFREDIAEAFSIAFDAAALHGTNSPFGAGQNIDATTKAVEIGTGDTVYNDIVAGLAALVNAGKKLNGFAFDSVAEPLFLDSVDANNRPLWIDTPLEDTVLSGGRLIGRRAFMGDGVSGGTVVGYGGDWSQAIWGVVGGIKIGRAHV